MYMQVFVASGDSDDVDGPKVVAAACPGRFCCPTLASATSAPAFALMIWLVDQCAHLF